MNETPSVSEHQDEAQSHTSSTAVDLEALAEVLLQMLKREARIESERWRTHSQERRI